MSSGDVCDRTITETITVQFTPQAADDESYELTQQFAGYVTKIMQASRAVDEAWTQMGVCILGGTIAMGFFWVLFLWLFAGALAPHPSLPLPAPAVFPPWAPGAPLYARADRAPRRPQASSSSSPSASSSSASSSSRLAATSRRAGRPT